MWSDDEMTERVEEDEPRENAVSMGLMVELHLLFSCLYRNSLVMLMP